MSTDHRSSVISEPQVIRWGVVTRIVFRFSFVYLGLFSLATQISGSLFLFPDVSFRGFGTLSPMRDITFWLAAHVFHVTEPLVYGRNSGETMFFWVQTFWILIAAILAAAIWTWADRRR